MAFYVIQHREANGNKTMRFQCPFCRGIVAVENSDMGSDVQCGHCGEVVTVPCSRLATGAVIADFIILEELGRGGMGIVYLAHQISLDRPAAVKILADTYANNAEFVVNFIKEARVAAKLNHPHIVQAYAVGEDEGVFFFAMEHIDGETMKQVLRREKVIGVEKCVTIIQQIAEALDYAWKEAKLIHRDIKPDNIMITKNGRAKLADLGLSKVAGDVDDSDSDEVMGTPQYISPEHLTGAPMDVRSDIYSLGATFYHLLTGRFPFEGRTATEIARKHLEEKLVPPQLVNPEIPIAIGQVIEKMMAKNIKNRYQDAEQLVDDLRMVRRGKRPPSATQGVKTPGQTKLGMSVSSTRKQLQTQLKTINMHLSGMMGKTQTGTVADLDSLSTLEYRRQYRRKVIITSAIILMVALGLWLLWYLSMAPKGGERDPLARIKKVREKVKQEKAPESGVVVKPEPATPKESPFTVKVKELVAFMRQHPDRRDEFMSRVDEFVDSRMMPADAGEGKLLDELMNTFIPLDESRRVIPARDKLEEKYVAALEKVVLERQRKLDEENRRNLEARMRKERELEEQRRQNSAEAQQKRKAEQFAAKLKNERTLVERKIAELAAENDFAGMENLLQPLLKTVDSLPPSAQNIERDAARNLQSWADTLLKGVRKAAAVHEYVYNGNFRMAGTNIEVKGELVKIESIRNGVLDAKALTGGAIDKVKLDDLPLRIIGVLVRKAVKDLNDDDAFFFYAMFRGELAEGIRKLAPSPEWNKEFSTFAYNYFRFKLKNANEEERGRLSRTYGTMPEFKKASN